MSKRTDAANSLGKKGCISRVLSLQDAFKSSEDKAGTLGVGDDTFIIYFSIYSKVAFNSG